MKLILAQGNPGREYTTTRHNIGFTILDTFVSDLGLAWKKHTKANADTTELKNADETVLLVKPLTFYNETGIAARQLVDFFKLDPAHDVLVLHDDLSLPFGTIRVRHQGNPAGNNGIKSLNAYLGDHYARIKIGIWNDQRDVMGDTAFVLGSFSASERTDISEHIAPYITEQIQQFIAGKLMNDSQTIIKG